LAHIQWSFAIKKAPL